MTKKSASFTILGEPLAKQSVKFAMRAGKSGKSFIHKYQPKKITDNANNIQWDIKSQLPSDFSPFTEAIAVDIVFVFAPLSSWLKKKLESLKNGEVIWKTTKPDADNCVKQVLDSIAGIVFLNDATVADLRIKKIYGFKPRMEILVTEL